MIIFSLEERETGKEGRLMELGKAFIDQREQMFFCFSVNNSGLLCIEENKLFNSHHDFSLLPALLACRISAYLARSRIRTPPLWSRSKTTFHKGRKGCHTPPPLHTHFSVLRSLFHKIPLRHRKKKNPPGDEWKSWEILTAFRCAFTERRRQELLPRGQHMHSAPQLYGVLCSIVPGSNAVFCEKKEQWKQPQCHDLWGRWYLISKRRGREEWSPSASLLGNTPARGGSVPRQVWCSAPRTLPAQAQTFSSCHVWRPLCLWVGILALSQNVTTENIFSWPL